MQLSCEVASYKAFILSEYDKDHSAVCLTDDLGLFLWIETSMGKRIRQQVPMT